MYGPKVIYSHLMKIYNDEYVWTNQMGIKHFKRVSNNI